MSAPSVVMVVLFGPPAVGKLTVGRELCDRMNLALFHNHLTVDLVTALFEFGTEPFVELRERIWLESFRSAAEAGRSFAFTLTPERTVAPDFIDRARRQVEGAGSRVVLVELTCPERELERRIESEDRARFGKLRSAGDYVELRRQGAFDVEGLPEPDLQIDTSQLEPVEAARRIIAFLESRDGGQ